MTTHTDKDFHELKEFTIELTNNIKNAQSLITANAKAISSITKDIATTVKVVNDLKILVEVIDERTKNQKDQLADIFDGTGCKKGLENGHKILDLEKAANKEYKTVHEMEKVLFTYKPIIEKDIPNLMQKTKEILPPFWRKTLATLIIAILIGTFGSWGIVIKDINTIKVQLNNLSEHQKTLEFSKYLHSKLKLPLINQGD